MCGLRRTIPTKTLHIFFRQILHNRFANCVWGVGMPQIRLKTNKTSKRCAAGRKPKRRGSVTKSPKPVAARPKPSPRRLIAAEREHAVAEALAEARKSHERLREAIDILPQGIVFLDAEGRYILWNKKYAEIYKRSADLFKPGARLQDTIRVGVARGDYPEAIGREEEWIAERLRRSCISPASATSRCSPTAAAS